MKQKKLQNRNIDDALLKIDIYSFTNDVGALFEQANEMESTQHKPDLNRIKKLEANYCRKTRQRKIRRIAILVTLLAVLLALAFSALAIRSLIYHSHDSYTSIHQNRSESSIESELYVDWEGEGACFPSYIPDGFVMAKSYKYNQTLCAEFYNSDGAMIILNIMPLDANGNIDTEKADLDNIFINGSQALLSLKDSNISIAWDYEEWTILLVGMEVDQDSLVMMANSIK